MEEEYVDLGLPSGLKWARCNIGAENETDCGLFFQWGDVVGFEKDELEYLSEEEKVVTRYTIKVDGVIRITKYSGYRHPFIIQENDEDVLKTELDRYDDGVCRFMGGNWRMPTRDECLELLDNTTSEYIENYQDSGISGYLLVSKINNEKLFFPCNLCKTLSFTWTKSVSPSGMSARALVFDKYEGRDTFQCSRHCFYTLRGVCG